MVLYRAREDRYEVIDYGMRAPLSLDPADYPLTADGGAASDIFPWARVKDDRNLRGPSSIAVPGVAAGMDEAHRRHAKLPWRDLLSPAFRLGRRRPAGGLVTTIMISSSAADLRRYPASSAAYLLDGLPPNPHGASGPICGNAAASSEVRRLNISPQPAQRDFYEGTWRKIAADVQAGGGTLSAEDLAAFRAHVREPLEIPYRGGTVYATP